jgi:hypothetical protein
MASVARPTGTGTRARALPALLSSRPPVALAGHARLSRCRRPSHGSAWRPLFRPWQRSAPLARRNLRASASSRSPAATPVPAHSQKSTFPARTHEPETDAARAPRRLRQGRICRRRGRESRKRRPQAWRTWPRRPGGQNMNGSPPRHITASAPRAGGSITAAAFDATRGMSARLTGARVNPLHRQSSRSGPNGPGHLTGRRGGWPLRDGVSM